MTEMRKPKVDLKELAKSQTTKTIEVLDAKGKKTGEIVELKMQEADWKTKLQINDLQNVGNNTANEGEWAAKLLEKVLVSPRIDFETMNKAIEDAGLNERELTYKDHDDAEHKYKAIFPGYRDALNIINEATGVDGAYNLAGFFEDANRFVVRDDKNKPVTFDFWKNADNLYAVYADLVKYLNEALNYNGYTQIISELSTFLEQ